MERLVGQNGDISLNPREQYEQNELYFHYPTYHQKHCIDEMF